MEPEAAAQIAMPHRSVPAAHAIDERATPWTWAARQAEPGVPSATAKTRLWFYVFLFALMAVPYGISNAIIAVIIPYRMRLSGYSVEQIGLFFSILMAPTYLQFVYSPLADWRFSKRTWVILSAVASAVCFALPEYWAKSNHYSPLVLAVVLLGQVASGLFLCSLGALISTLFTGRARDHAASCRVAGTFAGNLLGTVLALRPEGTASPLTNAALFGLLTLVPALFVLCLPVPVEPQPDASGHIVHDLRQFRRDPRFWITLLLSVSPSCAAGLLGLFSALAVDFRATPGHVVLANGTLGSLSMVLGSMLAGPLSGWGDRRTLYVACSASLSMIATAMAFMPLLSSVYLGGVLIYNFICGISYAVFDVMIIDLIGPKSRYAATKYGFFFSISNLPVAYVAYIDSRCHHLFGVRSVFLIDALLNIAGIAMWAILWRQIAQKQRLAAAAVPVS